jgi:hypothetical protein
MRFIEITIETMEPTIYLSIFIYYLITNFYLLFFSLVPSTNKISYFKAKCLLKLLYCFFLPNILLLLLTTSHKPCLKSES